MAGYGPAGASAAIAAHDAGAHVIVVDSAARGGGNARYSGGFLCDLPADRAVEHLDALCFGRTDPRVLQAYADGLHELRDWLGSWAGQWRPSIRRPGGSRPRSRPGRRPAPRSGTCTGSSAGSRSPPRSSRPRSRWTCSRPATSSPTPTAGGSPTRPATRCTTGSGPCWPTCPATSTVHACPAGQSSTRPPAGRGR
ncbi:MAG: FAD-binding protein [Streptosporangiaceae bacterium]